MKFDQLKKIVSECFHQQEGLIAVLLYGSQAKGLAKKDSDIDIAALYAHDYIPDPMKLWEIQNDLEAKLNCKIDLICLNRVSTMMASQAYKYHQPLLINDQKKLDQYFMILISDYIELKELRKPMEDRILERRYYHGS